MSAVTIGLLLFAAFIVAVGWYVHTHSDPYLSQRERARVKANTKTKPRHHHS